MNIKPRTGRRNYAKGGLVEDEDMGVNPVGVNPVGVNPVGVNPVGVNPVGVNPVGQNVEDAGGGPSNIVDSPRSALNRVKPARFSRAEEAEFLAYTPDKMEGYSSELRRAWNRKNAPNG